MKGVIIFVVVLFVGVSMAAWDQLGRSEPSAVVALRFALKQRNLDVLEVFIIFIYLISYYKFQKQQNNNNN